MSILIFDLELAVSTPGDSISSEMGVRRSGAPALDDQRPGAIEPAACLGWQLSRLTGWRVAPLEWRIFEDGEFKLRPLCDVQGHHLIVIARAAPHRVHDRLVALGLFLWALRRQRPADVNVVLPCLPYGRKDRSTQLRDPLSLQWVARLLGATGLAALWTFEPHEPAATENAFDCPVHVLSMSDWVAGAAISPDVFVSPDAGGVRRALQVRSKFSSVRAQSPGFALMDKHREAGAVTGDPRVIGDVSGLRALVVDDLVVSGASLERTTRALVQAGAFEVHALIAHGRPSPTLIERLAGVGLRSLVLSDSLAPTIRYSGDQASASNESSTSEPMATSTASEPSAASEPSTASEPIVATATPDRSAAVSSLTLSCSVRPIVPVLARQLKRSFGEASISPD